MTSEFKKIVAALKTVKGFTVIETTYVAMSKEHPLPSVVVDLEAPSWDTITEDNSLMLLQNRASLTFFAPLDPDTPSKTMQTIETNIGAALKAIQAAYAGEELTIEQPEYDAMPYGKTGIAWGLGFKLTIGQGV